MAKKKEKTLEEKLQEALVPENQWPYMLPENWCWTRLKYIANTVTGGTPSKKHDEYYGGDFPFYKPADLDSGRDLYSASEYLSDLGKNYAKFIPKGSVAVCCIGSIGKTGYFNIDGCTNQQINSIIPKINSLFVFYYASCDYFTNELWTKSSATTISIVNKSKMDDCYIPLPPLSEQKRIVHRIESLFAKLDEAKEKIQQVLDGAEMRKAAILHKAFTGELTKNWRKENGISEDSWESVKLKELGEFNRGKSKHRPRNDPRLFNGPYPFIQTGDVSSSGMYIQKHSQTLSEFGMQQSRLFPKDTLCITIAANIGKVAILTYDCCFPDSVVGFTPNERTFSKYMYYSMLKIQKEIEALAPAVAQKNLSLKLLLDVNVQIPSVEEQHTIVKIIERLLKHEKNVISASMRSIESIETMKKSILAKAFRGELGTNNPTEDSALNLLKEVLQDKS